MNKKSKTKKAQPKAATKPTLVALVRPAKAVVPEPPKVPYYYPIPSLNPSHVWVACCDKDGNYPDEGAVWEPHLPAGADIPKWNIMTEDENTLAEIHSMIDSMPHAEKIRVMLIYEDLKNICEGSAPNGYLALALLGAEKAAEKG